MRDKIDDIQRNPSSGRPVMSDIVARTPRQAPLRRVEKPVREKEKEVEIPLKKAPKKELPKKTFMEFPKDFPKKERRFPRFSFSLRTVYILLGAVLFFGVAFWILGMFSGAKIVITPRQEFVDVNESFSAGTDATKEIALESVMVEDTMELQDSISTTRTSTEKASGKVVIYNTYSTSAQTLVATTRLESKDGKIYRIPNTIQVPGGKMVSGKMQPGSIEVTVFAEKIGTEYNTGLTDFTIPGFKGSDKYTKFYARSKTEITGGFSGSSKVVLKENVDALLKRAEDSFRASLKDKIQRDLPADIFLPEDTVEIKVTLESVDPPVNSPGDLVKVKVKGTAQALALKRSDISKALVSSGVKLASGENAEVINLENLDIQATAKNFEDKTLTLKITGRAQFVWGFDEEKLKEDLAGASRKTRREVFKNYSGIERAEIDFSPSWWRIFPNSTKSIKVERILKNE